jgi:hypothetical protein
MAVIFRPDLDGKVGQMEDWIDKEELCGGVFVVKAHLLGLVKHKPNWVEGY